MKKLIFILLLSAVFNDSYSQEVSIDSFIVDSLPRLRASCSNPTGEMLEIAAPPSSYNELESNGYCGFQIPNGVQTACFYFEVVHSDISINSGWSSSCVNTSFGNFELWSINPCTLYGTGLNYTNLPIGDTMVFCLTVNSWGGGPSCTGIELCPYFYNTSSLPITLTDFTGTCQNLYWRTETETNNDYFIIEHSPTGEYWTMLDTMSGHGTTTTPSNYYYFLQSKHILQYYRLIQVDYDGKRTIYNAIAVHCQNLKPKIEMIYNVLGQKVELDTKGLIFVRYDDGSVKRIFNE